MAKQYWLVVYDSEGKDIDDRKLDGINYETISLVLGPQSANRLHDCYRLKPKDVEPLSKYLGDMKLDFEKYEYFLECYATNYR